MAFVKIIEVLREEMNKSLKDKQENTHDWRKWIDPLKNAKKKKTMQEQYNTVQDLKMEREAMEKHKLREFCK